MFFSRACRSFQRSGAFVMGVNDQIHTIIETHSSDKEKIAVIIILSITAIILTIISLQADIEIVFTHFFYVPIIITAYWYRLKGIIYTSLLSVFYLLSVYLLMGLGNQAILAAAGRVVMFISIAIVIAVLSEIIHRQKEVLKEKNRDLLESNNKLAVTEKELRNNLIRLAENELNLVASRERIQLILESSAEGLYGIDREGNITFINSAAVKMLGYNSPIDFLGKDSHEFLHHSHSGDPSYPQRDCNIWHALSEGATTRCDNDVFWRKDGTSFPVAYCVAPLIRNGAIEGAVVSFGDITERMEMMDHIQVSLKEKELLLKEIHHRVKNNLQIIASLLNLQARYIRDESVLDAIKESQNRVRAMALVHERLYRSGDLSRIDIGDYIQFLLTNLLKFYDINPMKITHSVSLKGVVVNIDTAIPLGLIINELISNSLKHAFPDGRRGNISIKASMQPDGPQIITIQDNGIGVPEGFDWKTAESLGLRLVVGLVEQIHGRIELKRGEGTTWEITIPSQVMK
jgi:PAS domain S-box-containing protein